MTSGGGYYFEHPFLLAHRIEGLLPCTSKYVRCLTRTQNRVVRCEVLTWCLVDRQKQEYFFVGRNEELWANRDDVLEVQWHMI